MKRHAPALPGNQIVIDEPALQKGFTVVPNYLFGLKGLSHGARLTYVLLLKYAWQEGSCFPGIAKLGQLLEVERKSVIRYTHELVARGLVTVARRGQGKTNVYHINRWGRPPLDQPACPTLRRVAPGRSPMDGTSGSPADGTFKSPIDGTQIIPSPPKPSYQSVNAGQTSARKEPAHVQYVVDEILKVCKDPQSIAFYRQVAIRFDDDLIFRWLAEIRQDPTITNRGAVFVSKVKAWQQQHGAPAPTP